MPEKPIRRKTMAEKVKKCPFCGEEILAVAIKCKHCGSDLAEKPAAVPEIDSGENIGYALLLIPVIAILLMWLWVYNMTLLEN